MKKQPATSALDTLSTLLLNRQFVRDKKGQFAKVGSHGLPGATGTLHTGSSPSATHDLHTEEGLLGYIKSHPDAKKVTPLTLKKLQMLNPNGLGGGKVVLPTIPNGPDNQAQTDLFKSILPPGTTVKGKYVTKKHVEDWEAAKGGATSTPAAAPAKSHSPYTTDKITNDEWHFKHEGKHVGDIVATYGGMFATFTPGGGKTISSGHTTIQEAQAALEHHHAMTGTSTPAPAPQPAKRVGKLLPTANVNDLTVVKMMPNGSNGAQLVKDQHGKEYVLKMQNDSKHGADAQKVIKNELHADEMYRAAGVNVPNSGLVSSPDGKRGKRSDHLADAQTLSEWSVGKSHNEIEAMHKKIGEHFVMDALLGNWDVIGMNKDNIMVRKGEVLRVDNGGSLEYRASGKPKGSAFGNTVDELQTMRNSNKNPQAAEVFKHVTDADIKKQIADIMLKAPDILKATPSHLKKTMEARLDHLENLQKTGSIGGTTTPLPMNYGTGVNPQTSIPTSATLPSSTVASLPYGGAFALDKSKGSLKYQVVPQKALVEKGTAVTIAAEIKAPHTEIKSWYSKLSSEEKGTVKSYTGSSYGAIRQAVASGPPYDSHTQAFISAVEKAPQIKGPATIYRGIGGTFSKELQAQLKEVGVGAVLTENAHQSTTRHPSKAFAGGQDSILFHITSKTARHIEDASSYPGEKELLVLPNTQFRVTRIIESPNLSGTHKSPGMLIHLEEI